MLAFYIATTKQLQRRLPLQNKKKKTQPGALAKALPYIIMETDITAIKDEWKTFMAVKNSNLPAFNCDIGTSTITG